MAWDTVIGDNASKSGTRVIGDNAGGSGTLLMFDDYLLSKDTVKCDNAWDLDTVIGDNAGGSVTQF